MAPSLALEALIKQRGLLPDAALARAQQVAMASRDGLPLVLIQLGLLRETEVAMLLGEALHLDVIDSAGYPAEPPAWCSLSVRFLREHRVVPLAEDQGHPAIAVVDPTDDYPARAIALACGHSVRVKVGLPSEVDAVLLRLYPKHGDDAIDLHVDGQQGAHLLDNDVARLRDMASDAPVIRFVNRMFQSAIAQGASDIHLEPDQSSLRVRLRVDGELRETDQLSKQQQPAIFSRLKILAGLNIAERRLPQDGRIDLAVAGNPVDLRIAVIPTVHGESAVVRILNRSDLRFDFAELGLSGASRSQMVV